MILYISDGLRPDQNLQRSMENLELNWFQKLSIQKRMDKTHSYLAEFIYFNCISLLPLPLQTLYSDQEPAMISALSSDNAQRDGRCLTHGTISGQVVWGSGWRSPCWVQLGWTRWPLRFSSNQYYSMILRDLFPPCACAGNYTLSHWPHPQLLYVRNLAWCDNFWFNLHLVCRAVNNYAWC